ncbi:MAG: hypothetical protein JW729_02095, partial [Bacteroidales bacterium]|nr:hypothetical protein [Bacteroidales bacterium]
GMAQDTSSKVYFIASKSGLYKKSETEKNQLKIYNGEVYSVFVDRNNILWYSSSNGIFYQGLDELSQAKEPTILNESLKIPKSPINGISQSKNGSIWLKNSTHLYQVISPSQQAIQYSSGDDLLNNYILSYTEDSEGNLWIGYSGGLQRIINNKNIRNLFPDELNSSIASVLSDALGNVWVSSNKWIYRYDGITKELENISQKLNLDIGHGIIKQLTNNHILIIHEDGIYEIDPQTEKVVVTNRIKLKGIGDAFFNKQGELFVLSNSLGLLYYFENYKESYLVLQNEHTSNLLGLTEHNGKLMGVNNNTLVRFNGNSFIKEKKFPYALSAINSIDNKLWLGTSKGVAIYDDFTTELVQLDDNLVVKSILPSRNRNHVWIGTNLGVYYFNIEQLQTVFKITSKEGLSGNEVMQNGLYLDTNGLLWIPTYHGLSNFNLKGTIDSKSSPKCYLENVKVNDEPIDFDTHKVWKYDENNLAFELSGLFYSDEKSVVFEHYLRNSKGAQSYFRSTKENVVYYNNLAPGSYEFVYRARGKDGIWSYTSSYSFQIEKPIWQTWLFRIAAFLISILLLYSVYKINVRRIEQQKKQLEKTVKERTKDLELA